jgi:TonB family protein
VNDLRRFPRHAWLPLLFLCGAQYCLAQSGGAPPRAVESDQSAWKEFSPPGGGFTVSLPGDPDKSTREVGFGVLTIPETMYTLSSDVAAYVVSYSDLHAGPDDPVAVRRTLDAGREYLLSQDAGGRLLGEREIALDGHAGREWLISGKFVYTVRTYFVKGRVYRLILGSAPDATFKDGRPSADPQDRTEFYEMLSSRFLDSFRLTAAQGKRGEVDEYLARAKVYGKAGPDSAGGVVDAGVLEGRALSLPRAIYPRISGNARAAGLVTVKVVVDEAGKVVAAQAVSGHPLLQDAAVKAAREARFAPALLGGKPVKVVGTITYNFVVQ